jgi:hypothetical protein
MTVKGNMPTLYRQLKKLPWTRIPAVSSVSTDHGRRTRRTIKAALTPAWIEFTGAAQVAQVRRTVTRKGRKTVEVVYLIGPYPLRWTPGLAARFAGRARNGFDTPRIYAGVQAAVGSFCH